MALFPPTRCSKNFPGEEFAAAKHGGRPNTVKETNLGRVLSVRKSLGETPKGWEKGCLNPVKELVKGKALKGPSKRRSGKPYWAPAL